MVMLRRLVLIAAVVGCVQAQLPERMATPDIELLVKQSVEDRFGASDLPDGNLLGKATRIAIREEMPEAGLKLGRGALPQRDGYVFSLISGTAAQAEADRVG